jgi:two-component system, cell cycle sensor histidine kinase and response regulator CckA
MRISTPNRQSVLRALLDATPLPMLVGTAEPALRVLAVNRLFSRLFGYRRLDLDGSDSWWSLAFPDPIYRARVAASFAAALGREPGLGETPAEPIEANVHCRDRSVRHVAFYPGLYRGYAFVLCTDQTARREAESALKEAREFLQRVVDTSPSMIFVVDEAGRLVFVNRSVAEYYGAPPEGMLSRATQDLHVHMAQAHSYVQDDLDVIRTGKTLVKEELNTAPDGREHWFHTVKVPLTRPDGRVHCLGIATDISARKEAERARRVLEAGMWQSQKLESLGVLAGGVAHDFNNFLASIRSNAALALARLPQGSEALPFVEAINRASEQAAELTRQMLTYGGQSQPSLQALHLEDVASEMRTLLQSVVSKKAAFLLRLGSAPVEADPAQIRQVMMNLIVNASEALGEGTGRITIRTGSADFESNALRSPYVEEAPPPGRYSFVEVEDEGCGMQADTLTRIFEPFFSTKFAGRGLGLPVVLGIVRGHRGTLQIESWVARGTRVTVLLPCARPPALGGEVAPAPRGTLLVIDDEDLVRNTACVLLEDAGFRVLSASDGQDGLEVFREHSGEFDAVVLDLIMPRLDGWQCLRALRALRPDIPVLLMSGYPPPNTWGGDLFPAPAFIAKPFDPARLLNEVSRLIAAGRGFRSVS